MGLASFTSGETSIVLGLEVFFFLVLSGALSPGTFASSEVKKLKLTPRPPSSFAIIEVDSSTLFYWEKGVINIFKISFLYHLLKCLSSIL